jgi:hypothetical protein
VVINMCIPELMFHSSVTVRVELNYVFTYCLSAQRSGDTVSCSVDTIIECVWFCVAVL